MRVDVGAQRGYCTTRTQFSEQSFMKESTRVELNEHKQVHDSLIHDAHRTKTSPKMNCNTEHGQNRQLESNKWRTGK